MLISDWSSDVCSSDLATLRRAQKLVELGQSLRLLLGPVARTLRSGAAKRGPPMAAEPIRLEARNRSARMLQTAFGAAIAGWLADPQVVEIMLTPDGRLWVDRLGAGIAERGTCPRPAEAKRHLPPPPHPCDP